MKLARFFGIVFGILGLVLMIGTAGLCFTSIDAPTQVAQLPQAGLDCAREVMEAIAVGDLSAAARRMYGQPQLGAVQEPESPEAQRLWQAFLGSLSYEFQGTCYITETGFAQKAVVTALDLPAITAKVETHARDLLNARIAAATVMTELYDEEGNFLPDMIREVMDQAFDQALAEASEMKSQEVTLGLVHREDAWWAVPDEALLRFLAGGL